MGEKPYLSKGTERPGPVLFLLPLLSKESYPRATEMFLLFFCGFSVVFELALAVSYERVEQRVGFLGVEVETIGEIGVHRIFSFLTELPETFNQSFPILPIQLLEDFDKIKDSK